LCTIIGQHPEQRAAGKYQTRPLIRSRQRNTMMAMVIGIAVVTNSGPDQSPRPTSSPNPAYHHPRRGRPSRSAQDEGHAGQQRTERDDFLVTAVGLQLLA
jgi:hypothetical protein